jgi:hypothetical protein
MEKSHHTVGDPGSVESPSELVVSEGQAGDESAHSLGADVLNKSHLHCVHQRSHDDPRGPLTPHQESQNQFSCFYFRAPPFVLGPL